jgi:hypothetical protein
MMARFRTLPLILAALTLCLGSIHQLAEAGKKTAVKTPTRILYSGNFEGELEPCG